MTKSRGIIAPRHRWTAVEDELLRDQFPRLRTDAIAKALGLGYSTITSRAKKLGLKKSAEFLASPLAGRWDGRDNGHRFSKGHVPVNKGTKGVTGQHENCRATQFQKGHKGGSRAGEIGDYRVNGDGFVEIKFSDEPGPYMKRWEPVHRRVWRLANGPIPEGFVVAFKPGKRTTDPKLITPDVLELISLAENMRRNSFHQYGPEIVQLVQLRGAITRQINKRAKEST